MLLVLARLSRLVKAVRAMNSQSWWRGMLLYARISGEFLSAAHGDGDASTIQQSHSHYACIHNYIESKARTLYCTTLEINSMIAFKLGKFDNHLYNLPTKIGHFLVVGHKSEQVNYKHGTILSKRDLSLFIILNSISVYP